MPSNIRVEFSSVRIAVTCGILEFGVAPPDFRDGQPELGTKMSRYGEDLRDVFLGRFRVLLAKERVQRELLFGRGEQIFWGYG